jgi:UDP-N-acetylglucosamine--N-acetylmuramyl-(pentapeptide) pyrophosphoryl-undecaprenol N-acetylglucosamine transferase
VAPTDEPALAGQRCHIVVTGGLTGGHVFPAATLALALMARGHSVRYVGARGHLEEDVAASYGIPFTGFRFRARPAVTRSAYLARATVTLCAHLRQSKPDVVFSKGSLVGAPLVLASRIVGLPIVLHESDTVPGSEMLWLAKCTPHVCIGHEGARRFFGRPVHFTGNLPRPNFIGGDRDACFRRYGLPRDRPLVFVVGGSQGAQALNEVAFRAAPLLTQFCSVVHACGRGKLGAFQPLPGYAPVEVLGDEIRDVYAACDLVISRAGATAIEEALLYSVPAIYVPYPWAERDHQSQNARALASSGVAEVLPQDKLEIAELIRMVRHILADLPRYQAAHQAISRPNAEDLLCAKLLNVARRNWPRCA